jgi:hypothetical protein
LIDEKLSRPDRWTSGSSGSPLNCKNPRDEFVQIEGLDDIIIGAGVEAFDPVADLITCRDDDDRAPVLSFAKLAQEIEAASIGQMQIKKHKPIVDCAQRSFGVIKPLHPIYGVIGALEMRSYGLAEHRFVLNQQNSHGAFDAFP